MGQGLWKGVDLLEKTKTEQKKDANYMFSSVHRNNYITHLF